MPTSFPFLAIEYFSPLDFAFSWGGGSLGRDIVAGMRLDGNSSFINISSFVALAIIPRESHTEGEIGHQVMLTLHVFTFARSITTEKRSIWYPQPCHSFQSLFNLFPNPVTLSNTFKLVPP